MVKGIIVKQDVAVFLCNNLDHYTEWLSLNIFSHKIGSLTTKIDWKTQKNYYLLETKLANCEGTTEAVAQMALEIISSVVISMYLKRDKDKSCISL